MVNVFEICKFFIQAGNNESIPVSNITLQKLLYFAQGVHLAKFNEPLFANTIYAWKYGPVVTEVYNVYKNFGNNNIDLKNIFSKSIIDYSVSALPSNSYLKFTHINSHKEVFLRNIWNSLKNYDPFELVELTHVKGSPWYNIYTRYNGEIPKNTEISNEDLKEYFKSTFSN